MVETTLKDLDPRLQKQLQSADQSVARGNPAVAVDICSSLIEKYSECVDIRKTLRKPSANLLLQKGKGLASLPKVTNASMLFANQTLQRPSCIHGKS